MKLPLTDEEAAAICSKKDPSTKVFLECKRHLFVGDSVKTLDFICILC